MMGCITHASHTSQGQGQDKDKDKDARIADAGSPKMPMPACVPNPIVWPAIRKRGGTTACKGKIDQSREVQDQVRQGQVRQQKWPFGSWEGSHRAQGHGAPLKRAGGAVESALDGSGQIGPLKAPRLEGKSLDSAVRGGGVPPSAKRR
ncbi:hypothetical protein CFAM422_011970 [Trichoderma lentiforme]|uniref:Uncharacterized protein n=1 Tax=Trichoderma lentiforme TaxID=1567552 RepID=A0A9P5C6W0_9HYPO|nr:hypothetical protein CFAM422_011970 [Trichoderma lentiforme]